MTCLWHNNPFFLNLTHSYHYCVLFVIAFISWKCIVCFCSRYSQYMQILSNFFSNLSFFFPRNLLINWISFCFLFFVTFAQNWNPQFHFLLLNVIAWVEGWDFFQGSIGWMARKISLLVDANEARDEYFHCACDKSRICSVFDWWDSYRGYVDPSNDENTAVYVGYRTPCARFAQTKTLRHVHNTLYISNMRSKNSKSFSNWTNATMDCGLDETRVTS